MGKISIKPCLPKEVLFFRGRRSARQIVATMTLCALSKIADDLHIAHFAASPSLVNFDTKQQPFSCTGTHSQIDFYAILYVRDLGISSCLKYNDPSVIVQFYAFLYYAKCRFVWITIVVDS